MQISARDKKILFIIAGLLLATTGYVYVWEPAHEGAVNAPADEYHQYQTLLKNKEGVTRRYAQMAGFTYLRETPQKQQVGMQMYLQDCARRAGITDISTMRTGETIDSGDVVSLQMDFRGGITSVKNFLVLIASSDVPLRIDRLRMYGDETNPALVKVQIQVSMLWQNLSIKV